MSPGFWAWVVLLNLRMIPGPAWVPGLGHSLERVARPCLVGGYLVRQGCGERTEKASLVVPAATMEGTSE